MLQKLTPKQTKALSLAHEGVTEGGDFSNLTWYFVEKLPFQLTDNDYIAKVWGEDEIFVDSFFYQNLDQMLRKSDGRRIICHESVHQVQIKRWGWTKFCLKYALGLIKSGFSYRNNPLEQEAYRLEYRLQKNFEKFLNI